MNTPFWTPDANGFSFVSTQVKHSPLFGVMFLIELALIIAVVLRRNKSPLKRRPLALRLTTSIFFACGFLASSLPIPCPPYQFLRTVFGGCAIMFLIGHSVQSLKMIKSKIELFQDIHENVNNSTGSAPTTTSSSSNNNNNSNNNGNSNLKHSKSSTPDDTPTTGTSTSTVTNTNSSSSSSQRRDFIVRNQLYALLHSNALRRRSSNDKTGSSSRRPSPNASSHSSYNFDALDAEAAAAHLDLSRTRPVLALVLLGSLLYTAAYAATNGIVFSLYLNIGPGIDNVRVACPGYVSVAAFFAELILLLISESGFVYCIYVSHHFLKDARDALHLRNEMILAACIIPLRSIATLIVWLAFDSISSSRLLLGKLAWALPFLLIDAVTLVFRVFETFKSEANANASLLLMNAADSTVPVPALSDDAFRSPPDSETSGTAGVSSSGALRSSSSTTRRPSPLSNSTTRTVSPPSSSASSSSPSHTALTTTTGTTSTTATLTDSHDDDDDNNNNSVTEVAFPLKEYDHATRSSATHRDTTTESLSPLHQASRSTQSSDSSGTGDTLTTPSPSSSSCETIDDSVNASRKPHRRRRRKRRSNKPALRDSDERIVPVSRAHRPRASVPAADIRRRSQKHKMYTTQPPGCIAKLKRSTSASHVSQTAAPTGRKLSRHASDVEHFSRARDMLLPDEKRTQVSISSATTRRRPNKHEFRGETLGDDNDAYVRAKRKHGSSSTTNPSPVSLYSSSTSSNSIAHPFRRGRQTRVVAQSSPADSTVREQLRTRLRSDPEFRSQFAMFLTTEFAIENLSFYDDATALHELLTAPNVDLTRSEVQRVADGMLNVIRQNYLSRRCRYPVNLPQMLKDKLLSESWRDIDRWLVDALESVLDVMAFDLFVRFKP